MTLACAGDAPECARLRLIASGRAATRRMRLLMMLIKRVSSRIDSASKRDLPMGKSGCRVLASVLGFVMTLVSPASSECGRSAEMAAS